MLSYVFTYVYRDKLAESEKNRVKAEVGGRRAEQRAERDEKKLQACKQETENLKLQVEDLKHQLGELKEELKAAQSARSSSRNDVLQVATFTKIDQFCKQMHARLVT